jgi:hypothetical protein
MKFIFISILAFMLLAGCDCSNVINGAAEPKIEFINDTDSIVNLSFPPSLNSNIMLPKGKTTLLRSSTNLIIMLKIGIKQVTDSLNTVNFDSINVFNSEKVLNEDMGRGKCKYTNVTTTYIIKQENIDEAK